MCPTEMFPKSGQGVRVSHKAMRGSLGCVFAQIAEAPVEPWIVQDPVSYRSFVIRGFTPFPSRRPTPERRGREHPMCIALKGTGLTMAPCGGLL